MNTITTLLLLFVTATISFAQKDDNYLTNITQNVYSPNFEKAQELLEEFLKNSNARLTSMNKTKTSNVSKFHINNEFKPQYDSLVKVIGYVNTKDVVTNNYGKQLTETTNEIAYLTQKKEKYNEEIESKSKKGETYDPLWREVRQIEASIHNLEKRLATLKTNSNYFITLRIHDDNVDLTSRRINWINMPGGSFDMLWVENPTAGISSSLYQGGSLKYLFTRGKSYAKLSILKSASQTNDSLPSYSELFKFSFGQDYYTKHFGRGKRKFFNLYSGYDVGGVFATGQTKESKFLPFVKVHLGVELFKNKYFLIDNKISYFVPFVNNREFRGLAYSASINFVF